MNLITVHDGFTLADLVSYDTKHNEANGEDNRDGTDDNRSWNCGVEGPTDDPAVLELRARQRRNFIATLMLSDGVPLLLGGDEFGAQPGRQQQRLLPGQRAHLVRLERGRPEQRPGRLHRPPVPPSRAHPVFRRRQFFTGAPAPETGRDDLDWYRPDGNAMTPQTGDDVLRAGVTMALSGATGDDARPDDPFLVLVNAWWEPLDFTVPESLRAVAWQVEIDTADPAAAGRAVDPSTAFTLTARSLMLLQGTSPTH